MTEAATRDSSTVVGWMRRHPDVRDAVAYAALAVVGAALGIGLWGMYSLLPAPVSSWWSLATALPAAALIFLRARAPRTTLALAAALLVVDLATVGGIVPFLVVLDALSVVTLRSSPAVRRRILWAIIVVVALAAVSAFLVVRDPSATTLVALQAGALLGFAYWYGTSQAQANELVALHRQRALDAERLGAQDRMDAVRHEREDMARELHDLVAGHVSAMAIRSEASLSSPPDVDRDRAALRAVRDSSIDAHTALRSMIAVLRSGSEASVSPPRRAAVTELVADARRNGLSVRLQDDVVGGIPVPVEQAIARIVQEALANCLRHAAGAEVDVTIVTGDSAVIVDVRSRGGAPLAQPVLTGSGWGLNLLAERTRALGGSFHAGPRDDAWVVRAELPTGDLR